MAVAFAWLVGALVTPAEAGRGEPDPKRVQAMEQIREGSLRVGDPAPDVPVVALDGQARMLLADRGSRPLVLVFGSFT